ncbi:glycosyltransferase family 2 protein [Shewanella waksmanii]|uniref:glycosyltransferase family 2 protein n=1 Tax=Shewanella waksmanii TaxID=213783 RepID=UPI0004B2F079|nr:glycosyltransferase family 2 protein [Shewanella waksmanii]
MSDVKLAGKTKTADVCVLLATYNGEKFIAQQINSIFKQQNVHAAIILRDDGSSDATLDVVTELAKEFSSFSVTIKKNSTSTTGHVSNFSALCDLARNYDGSYFCFSDQDDVWHKDKLSKMKRRMLQLEAQYGSNTPILIHSDLRVVDEELTVIADSFVKFQGLPSPNEHDFPKFLYQNVVTGCTTFFNRALLELASPIPSEVLVHDWWFAQCAKLHGVLDYIDEPLIDYRQHGRNAIGAKSSEQQNSYLRKHIYLALMRFPKHLARSVRQAKALNALSAPKEVRQSAAKLNKVEQFSKLAELSISERLRWANIAINNPKALNERWYFKLAFFVVRWIKP